MKLQYRHADEVHIVPDRYDQKQSVQDGEKERQSIGSAVEMQIRSRSTKLPSSLKLSFMQQEQNQSSPLSPHRLLLENATKSDKQPSRVHRHTEWKVCMDHL